MSLVVFPVKEEDPDVVVGNLDVAAAHDRVTEVWAVTAGPYPGGGVVDAGAAAVSKTRAKPVRVIPQQRLGSMRPGKGDAMNTALRIAAERGFERTHFYDADITNFGPEWIEGAERGADRGFQVVRHRFPRAATDAMITWMVTRPGLALLFPDTLLPRLGQPLGGELLLSREVVESLAADRSVLQRSDWGIDTMLTYGTATMGHDLYEHELSAGKLHALYGSLSELRTMVLECLDAVASLAGRAPPAQGTKLAIDPGSAVPDDLKRLRGFDLERSATLLFEEPAPGELELTHSLPGDIGEQLRDTMVTGEVSYMDEEAWGRVLGFLLSRFRLGEPGWESLAFRLWLVRVLAYATGPASRGYEAAMDYLEATIRQYEARADQDVRP